MEWRIGDIFGFCLQQYQAAQSEAGHSLVPIFKLRPVAGGGLRQYVLKGGGRRFCIELDAPGLVLELVEHAQRNFCVSGLCGFDRLVGEIRAKRFVADRAAAGEPNRRAKGQSLTVKR